MSSRAIRIVASVCLAHFVTLAAFVAAQSAIRLGNELQVNTYTTGAQRFPDVGVAAGGGFVVTWDSAAQDGEYDGVFARRFASSGAPLAGELQVNQRTIGYQRSSAVVVAAGGDFVVTWRSYDGSFDGIFVRRFDSAGAALTGELQVNTYTTGFQIAPGVAIAGDGSFVVAWQSAGQDAGGAGEGVFARRFSAAGAALGGEFQVNTYTADTQIQPSIAARANGDFMVSWSSLQDGAAYGIFARRFDSAGVPQATELQVNTHTTSDQRQSSIAAAGAGFVVAWQSFFQDGDYYGIFAQRFDSTGARQAGEIQVNVVTSSFQNMPDVVGESDGSFIVVWQSFLEDGSAYGVFGRRFNADGVPLAGEFQLNSYTADSQRFPAVSARGGEFVVAWHSASEDGFLEGIFAQRMATLAILDIDGDGATEPLTDGLLVLRFLFGFEGPVLTAGAVSQGCTRCDPMTIATYLETLI